MDSRRSRLASLFGAVILLCAAAVRAQPTTAPAPRGDAVELHEWVVLVCDRNQQQANARTAFRSTLPPFVGTRRPAAEQDNRNDVQPVGVIRLLGDVSGTPAEKIDVLLEMRGGTFVAHWPKARTKPNRVLWQNIEPRPAGDAAGEPPERVDAGHWLTTLRAAAAPRLTLDGRGERFLLYDVELNFPPPLRVEAADAGKTAYEVGNTSSATAHDLVLYKNIGGTWHAGGLDELTASVKPATAPAATQPSDAATAPAVSPAQVLADVAPAAPTTARVALDVAPSAASVSAPATQPTTAAATAPASTQPAFDGVDVTLAPAPNRPAELLAPWRAKLAAAGLAAVDHDLILRVLETHALDPKRLTAVYRLDAADLDRMLPLDVTPTPRKTVRVGLVVVRGIDPAITEEIDALIAQLGHDDWNVREQAYKELSDFGPVAQAKLNEAAKHKDMEVVYRAERLLQRLAAPAVNPQ